MMEPSHSPDDKPATVDELEADIAATRDRLTESVDALADKVNVKARAEEKVDQTKAKAIQGARNAISQVRGASRPMQIALAGAPVVIVALIIVLRNRRG